MPAASEAAVRLYTTLNDFQDAVFRSELFRFTAGNVLLADEVTSLPTRNRGVGVQQSPSEGRSLYFDRRNTGLFYSFRFTTLQSSQPYLTFDDDEGAGNLPNFDNALSPGDIDNGENDDWKLRVSGREQLRGFGFVLRDNHGSSGERVILRDSQGQTVGIVTLGNLATNAFIGVVSDEPFVEILYDEDSGGDDIAVTDLRFARASDVENAELKKKIKGWSTTSLSALGTGILTSPPASTIAGIAEIAANVRLKYLPAVLQAPADVAKRPNSADKCFYEFDLPQDGGLFSNLFGLIDLPGFPTDWGDLGAPLVSHANSEVLVGAHSPHIPGQPSYEGSVLVDQLKPSDPLPVRLPAGYNPIDWKANTYFDWVFDVAVPTALLPVDLSSKPKGPSKVAAEAGDGTVAGEAWVLFKGFIVKTGKKVGVAFNKCVGASKSCASEAAKDLYRVGKRKAKTYVADKLIGTEEAKAFNSRQQIFTVYDEVPPTLDVTQPVLEFEATDFGGVATRRIYEQILASVEATDGCNRPVSLLHDLPGLLPLGDTTVNWTARDLGPKDASLAPNETPATQTIRIVDTQAPIMVPPPGKVVEVPAATGSLSRAQVDLGQARVVDLADPLPDVSNDAPADFLVDTRTQVNWEAADHADPPNVSMAEQWVTLKTQGSNTAPRVDDVTATTLTSQPVDLVLRGQDDDFLDGRFDPLGFEILDPPDNGEFVAPLYPFFIEDYRTQPDGPYPDAFDPNNSDPPSKWFYENVCTSERYSIDYDWVYKPKFISVGDDREVFFIDESWHCNTSSSSASTDKRISRWDAQGNYLGHIIFPDPSKAAERFVKDPNGFIHTTFLDYGTRLILTLLGTDFSGRDNWNHHRLKAWQIDNGSTDPTVSPRLNENTVVTARVDVERGLFYTHDKGEVYVYDVRSDFERDFGSAETNKLTMDDQLGALADQQTILSNSCGSEKNGFAMELDSSGALYVVDTCVDRIHKFEASGFDEDGNFVPGEYVGWMGSCLTSTNKACDELTGTSRGYSCTDQTCTRNADTSGDHPGQFNNPTYVAMGPNDVLYVADSANARIQRFGADGTFAGEAVSTGSGINRGENPGFVLGNFGNPKMVSVNSTQFYVVDPQESFVHVFETLPFTNITDDSVTVSYVSDFDFHSAQDSFSFRASDGLADSAPGTATIQVNRNFRAPIALPASLLTDEDTALDFELRGDDPDGIAGVDFNGLDTLTFEIVTAPMHGTLSDAGASSNGNSAQRTYTPAADYHGSDSFTFRTHDGNEYSAPARVEIMVNPVNDPPVIASLDLPDRIGRGFPVLLEGTFTDDDEAAHDASIDWGVGESSDSTGSIVDPGNGDPPYIDGVLVIEPTQSGGEGKSIGDHLYNTVASKTVTLCIGDAQEAYQCQSRSAQIDDYVNLAFALDTTSDDIPDGGSVQVTVTLTNLQPDGWAGLVADAVAIVQDEPELLELTAIPTRPGFCGIGEDGLAFCLPTPLNQGESISFTLEVQSSKTVLFDTDALLAFRATTGSPALKDQFYGAIALRVLADPTDTDGDGMTDAYEDAYGLNKNDPNDAGANNDGDDLSNLEEFRNRTNPKRGDSDQDGIKDDDELVLGTDPTDPDSDGDGLPDKWERDKGIDPLNSEDATEDPDKDGLTNREEFELGTDPLVADKDRDDVLDGADNCPTVANPDQANNDGDTEGDACDNDDDNDGMSDEYEERYGLNAFVDDADQDPDRDGLTNREEFELGTDPHNPDTDGDGIGDKHERGANMILVILPLLF